MPVPQQYGSLRQQQPSCLDKVKFGFKMGFMVGVSSGLIFGGFQSLRFGLRGRELVKTMGKAMLQGGTSFGLFMSVGTGIRC